MILYESLRLPDCLGVRQRWLREAVGLALKCTIFTKYKERVMSGTTASDGSWTLIHFARTIHVQFACKF